MQLYEEEKCKVWESSRPLVMDVLWRSTEPVRVRDVIDGLDDDREPAYTTVMTVHGQSSSQRLGASSAKRARVLVRSHAKPRGSGS